MEVIDSLPEGDKRAEAIRKLANELEGEPFLNLTPKERNALEKKLGLGKDWTLKIASRTVTVAELNSKISADMTASKNQPIEDISAEQLLLFPRVTVELGRQLSKLTGDVRVAILEDAVFDLLKPDAGGLYNGYQDVIIMRESSFDAAGNLESTAEVGLFIHENTHAATVHAIDSNPEFGKQLDRMRAIARRHMGQAIADGRFNDTYWDTNAQEYIAEAFSNSDFQAFLSQIPLERIDLLKLRIPKTKADKIRNVFDAFKALVADILQLGPILTRLGYSGTRRTLFEATMDLSAAILEAAPEARADYNLESGDILAAPRKRKPGPDTVAGGFMAAGVPQDIAERAAEALEIKTAQTGVPVTDSQLKAITEALVASYASAADGEKLKAKLMSKYSIANKKRQAEVRRLQAEAGEAVLEDFAPGRAPIRPWPLSLATNIQIAEAAGRYFGRDTNPVMKIAEAIERRTVLKSRYKRDMGKTVDALGNAQREHTRQQWEDFSSLAHDATTAEVHPDRTLEENDHLGKKVIRNTWKKAQHASLSARYQALPDSLKALYQETRDTLTNAQNQMSLKLMQNVLKKVGIDDMSVAKRFHEETETDADRALVGPELAAHIAAVGELKALKGPYFNLARRGSYVVQGYHEVTPSGNGKLMDDGTGNKNVVEFQDEKEAAAYASGLELRNEIKTVYVDKDTGSLFGIERDGTEVRVSAKDGERRFRVVVQNKHIEFTDTLKEAKRKARELKGAGLKVTDVEAKKWEREAGNAQMLSDQMRMLMTTAESRAGTANMSDLQKSEMIATMNEISLKFLGSTRIQSTRLPRRYVEGASKDLVQNTYDYVDSTAGYLARLDTQPDVEDGMIEMERRVKDVSSRGTGSGFGAGLIRDEINKRVLDVRYTDHESVLARATQRLSTLSFIDNLMSPAYSLVNATQVGMLTLPKLAGDFNAAAASFQITRAYFSVGGARVLGGGLADTVRAAGGRRIFGDRYIDDIKSRLKTDLERAMIDELTDTNYIDADGGMELERSIQRKGLTGTLIDTPLGYFENIARAVPQSVEAINRSVTAIASYRMMYSKTRDHDRAVQYAKEVVNEAQGLYSQTNAAPIFNHPIARLPLQFKKYPQLVYYALGKNVRRVIRPENPGDRRKGIKTLAYIAATHGAMAGATGALPWEILKIPLMMAKGFGMTTDEWEDYEDETEKFLTELTGDSKAGEVLAFGLPRALGVDLNTRIGLQNLLVFGEPRSDDERGYKTYAFDTIAGAAGRTVTDIGKGVLALMDGDVEKAMEGLIPMKLISDTAKANNGVASGKMTDADAALRVFGLLSARQARISRELGSEIRASSTVRNERTRLERRFRNARTGEARIKIIQEIRRYNANLPEGQRNISVDALRRYKARDVQRWQSQ